MILAADLSDITVLAMRAATNKKMTLTDPAGKVSNGLFDFVADLPAKFVGAELRDHERTLRPARREIIKLSSDLSIFELFNVFLEPALTESTVKRRLQPLAAERGANEVLVLCCWTCAELEFVIDHAQPIIRSIMVDAVHTAPHGHALGRLRPIDRQAIDHVLLKAHGPEPGA